MSLSQRRSLPGDRRGLASALRRVRGWADHGQLALIGCFILIVALALLEFTAPHVTAPAAAPAPAGSTAGRPHLPVLGLARLAGATPKTTYVAGQESNTLLGVSARRHGLEIQTWPLAAALGRTGGEVPTIEPSRSVTLEARTGVVAMTHWGPRRIPALLVAQSGRHGTRMEVLALTNASRPLATGISAARIGTYTSMAPADWNGHGADLVFVTRDSAGRTHLSVYAGPLGTGRLVASSTLAYPFPPVSWSLAIEPSARRPALAWITRDRSGSGSTELHIVLARGGYQHFSEQVATTLPDNQPELHFALGLDAGRQLQLYVIDPVLRLVGILSLAPVG